MRLAKATMSAKTFFMAKTFRAQSTNYLRQEKSLRDHGAGDGKPGDSGSWRDWCAGAG
jgi:hypothetical protein